ncbi:hypothetical protein ACFU51_21275, partial [Streptomyces sp. NPDC057430]
MRSARILFAATAAAATLAVTAPGAYAITAGDSDKDGSAHSQDHGKKDHGKPKGGMHTGSGGLALVGGDEWSKGEHGKKDHGKPKGGMHTGSGGLALVGGDEWSKGE